MSIERPDRDLQALTELYTASDLPRRGVTFAQFMDAPGRYLEGMGGRATLRPGVQGEGNASDHDVDGQRTPAQAAVVVDLQVMRERRQARRDEAATSGEDDGGLDFWVEE